MIIYGDMAPELFRLPPPVEAGRYGFDVLTSEFGSRRMKIGKLAHHVS